MKTRELGRSGLVVSAIGLGNLTPDGRQRRIRLDGKIRRGRAIIYFGLNVRSWRPFPCGLTWATASPR
jgi:hypothetical protein